ncbi:MAG TPA: formate dehydrogenase accessory protein FdhE [Candidatus Binatia bacterium]|nr:formate dehydrogenase accessory protein FdhE [Candidatus Binatia bacterium]
MTAIDSRLQDLQRQHPEWEPWLAVVQDILNATADPHWDRMVPTRAEIQPDKIPLLANVPVVLEREPVRRLLAQLIQTAQRGGTSKMATLKPALHAQLNVVTLFKASLCQDAERLREIAATIGADPEALQAVGTLLPVPFLQACNRHWARSIAKSWTEGYCPVCGAWPAFAEARGIERSRYFRCGRCGNAWQSSCLFCPYCSTTNHEELVSLVPEKNGSNAVIEACKRCHGYVKTFTKLQGSAPDKVLLDDLASVQLDVAALEQGYKRPQGAGYCLDVVVTDNHAA